MNKSEKKYLWN